MRNYLNELNEMQKQAVLHKDGPLMIIAGAGSGKTKVLTTRITHLMAAHQVDPFNILALTFTNKAAAEMKERIEHILGTSEARNLYIGTFHSVFARILRTEAPKIGYPNNFTIYDTDDARSVIKTVIHELNLDDKQYKPNVVYNRISAAKNALVGPEEYANDYHLQQEDAKANRPMLGQIFVAYANRCFKNGAMDFDDLLIKMYELLKHYPEALSKYQHKFKYILIDEYQDTNPAQYEIIKLLGAMHENVCVVGDDAQSIYSFRGATIQNILQFRKDYDDVAIVKLEQNYRSTQNILHIANEVIRNNKSQIEKRLFTGNEEGEKIKRVRTLTDNDEGKMVADTIQEQKLRYHLTHNDFAILYRTNAQSRSFEEALRRMGIPYKIYGGISFYQRKEIKDFLAYLRLLVNTHDDEALKRIINYPARGIGKTTLEKVSLLANEKNVSMWEVLCNAALFGFKSGTLESVDNFVTSIKMFQSELPKKNAYDLAILVGKNTGIVKELFNDKTTEGLARYENVQELLNSIKEFIETPLNDEDGEVGDKGLGTYLQQISLLTDADNDDEENADKVKLMTIHASKGLEFTMVFVAGLEETLFPNAMSINTREELEEERRLFYVAITRAKSKLVLSYANARYRFGQLQQNDPSRFLDEIPEEYVERSYSGQASRNHFNNGQQGTAFERMNRGFGYNNFSSAQALEKKKPSYLTPPPRPAVKEHIPSNNFEASSTSLLQEGQKVEHQKFGFGQIVKMEGASHNPIATIHFEQNGEKKIMLNYAKLRIVE
ncbi:MAG TPA: UvrD-helicase domain-containing protein [Ferruginibacter sp.]|nr:UvrD-helicase domain-containing protein [Bacteroidota bacterium]MBS1925091.1 UvrD-helicase domain-containing protein [Bacteroidota bacterium]HMT96004.1 UvrD-helicase domain-containing protein [Ferruginibacter sp.]HMU23984.1 UvrD-helicase domain-containing protein [Ferruginibacter sp.]